jgi:phytanoyl-CoA hydroxylase
MHVGTGTRVFFEPRIAPHEPELYAFERTDAGVPAALAGGDEALARYREEGFLTVRGLLTADEVRAVRAELEAMALSDDPGCASVYYEGAVRDHVRLDESRDHHVDGRTTGLGFAPGQEGAVPDLDPAVRARYVRKFMGFVDRKPALTALAGHPAVLEVVARLLGGGGGTPEMFQDMALVKPGGGREKPWHQDHAYFNVALDTPIVGVWIPMGEVTPENGCMHMLAGGHKAGPRPHFKRRDWQICDADVEAAGRVAVPMRAGDVLLFDGKLPHGTPVNRTGEHRWAVQYHYRWPAAVAVNDEARLAAFGSEGRGVTC